MHLSINVLVLNTNSTLETLVSNVSERTLLELKLLLMLSVQWVDLMLTIVLSLPDLANQECLEVLLLLELFFMEAVFVGLKQALSHFGCLGVV